MLDVVTDESFDFEKTYEYILSIQVSLNGFSFSVKQPTENKLLAYKNKAIKISSNSLLSRHFNEWYQTEDILHKTFKKVRIIIFSELFSLIPENLFNQHLKSLAPQILFDNKANFEIAENIINRLKAKLIFTLPPEMNSTLLSLFGEYEIIHPIKLIIHNLPEVSTRNGIFLLFDSGSFYTVLFNRDSVLLANNFKMVHRNDIVFYILTMLKQSGISSKQTTLLLTESTKQLTEIDDNLKTLFSEIIHLDTENLFPGSHQIIPYLHQCGI
jgi:hypothetical protein